MNIAPFAVGWVAQLVEQRTENPCVAGSIPASATTFNKTNRIRCLNAVLPLGNGPNFGALKFRMSPFCPPFDVLRRLRERLPTNPLGFLPGRRSGGDCARLAGILARRRVQCSASK